MATANAVALGTTVSGSSLSAGWGDHDYFAYDVPSAGRGKLSLTFPSGLGTGTAYEVAVYDQSGYELYDFYLDGGDWNGKWLAGQATYLPAGRVYVMIYGTDSEASWGQPYQLTVSVAAGVVETEPNTSTASADVESLGRTVSGSSLAAGWGDHDYFAYDVPSAGRGKLSLTFPSGLGTGTAYEVAVYDQSGYELYDFYLDGGDWNGKWLAGQATYLPAGRVYVMIYGTDSEASWGQPYQLTVSVAAGVVETEPNTSTASADVESLGRTVSGSSLAAGWGDHDYFAYDVTSAGRGKLSLTFPSGLGTGTAYEVAVYDQSGDELYDFYLDGGDWNGKSLGAKALALPAGRVYVMIYGTDSEASWGKPYQLTLFRTLTATPTPKISGTAKVGSTLKAVPGAWKPSPVTLSYQWLRNGTAIKGATGASRKVSLADAGKKITVRVTGRKTGYATVSKASAARAIPLLKLTATPTPKISGTAKVGSTLKAVPGAWKPSPVTLSYQWLHSGTAIKGATGASHKVTAADAGKKITVRVTGRKTGYATVSKTSAARVPKG
ncbi:hypothetical protein [Flexivirga oryzae]|uniref:Phage gp37-like protein n=1 Tax=Flexivirga oryzae TaxID=1794944 RepID=A0A839NAT0_9MICO|nr:hypothetical protein [Flexivirga oryzae]MBB2891712.1 phage gp37-like protein [Flexivirga oryzae]